VGKNNTVMNASP